MICRQSKHVNHFLIINEHKYIIFIIHALIASSLSIALMFAYAASCYQEICFAAERHCRLPRPSKPHSHQMASYSHKRLCRHRFCHRRSIMRSAARRTNSAPGDFLQHTKPVTFKLKRAPRPARQRDLNRRRAMAKRNISRLRLAMSNHEAEY